MMLGFELKRSEHIFLDCYNINMFLKMIVNELFNHLSPNLVNVKSCMRD